MAQSREKRASMKYRKEANLQGVYWPKRVQIETIGFLRRLEALWRIDHDGLAEHLSWRLFQEGLTSGTQNCKTMHPMQLNKQDNEHGWPKLGPSHQDNLWKQVKFEIPNQKAKGAINW